MSIVILKFGSSVLPTPEHVHTVVGEVYRHVRKGRRVVAVVSALRGRTDELCSQADRWQVHEPHARASLLATGEAEAAALVAGALARAGLKASLIDGPRLGLRATGDPLDATPALVEPHEVRRALGRGEIAVVPGFVGIDEHRRPVLLGRGGSDLTALALGAELRARVVLLKDAGWVHEWSPAESGPAPRRFETLSWDDALALTGRAIQRKAIEYAKAHRTAFRFSGLGNDRGTTVGGDPTRYRVPLASRPARRFRIALLGLGTVGGGVAEALALWPDRYELIGALVRSVTPEREQALKAGHPSANLTTDGRSLLRQRPDVVIEALGGLTPAHDLVREALDTGAHVVTANKAVIAVHGHDLLAAAARKRSRLLCSAAVGGALPVIELVRRFAATGGIHQIRAVLNGTSNAVLNDLAVGRSLDEALRSARAAGYAEADPTDDLSGLDAARKVAVLARVALEADVSVSEIPLDTIDARTTQLAIEARAKGKALRQVATLSLGAGRLSASVRLSSLSGRWRDLPAATNALEIVTATGARRWWIAQGAGRWPTTQAVLADLHDLRTAHTTSLGPIIPLTCKEH